MLLKAVPQQLMGVPEGAVFRFGRADPEVTFSQRVLFLSEKPAFELSLWCGTCPFIFERKEGANRTFSHIRQPLARLESPLEAVDPTILELFSPLLPEGTYWPLLLELQPQLVLPNEAMDYFSNEQVDSWGIDDFWGLPENPRTPYYRTFETIVEKNEHLFEFIVPMVPPSLNSKSRVEQYRKSMMRGITPTAVALTTLDVCVPDTEGEVADSYTTWGLSHFLLDGHHKVEAAASLGEKVRLLALVSLDYSLSIPRDLERLPEILSRPRQARGAANDV